MASPALPARQARAFYATVDLVNALEREKVEGKAGRIALSLFRQDLVVLDEIGALLDRTSGSG